MAKLKDGLFLGDAEAAQDDEFVVMNKISYFVNCAGLDAPNPHDDGSKTLLTFWWQDEPGFQAFDETGTVLDQLLSFIDEALSTGEAVLVYSARGESRCVLCVAAYMMARYEWGCHKVLDFIRVKAPFAQANEGFHAQLLRLDWTLQRQRLKRSAKLGPADRQLVNKLARDKLLEWRAPPPLNTQPSSPPARVRPHSPRAVSSRLAKQQRAAADAVTNDELVLVNSYVNSLSLLAHSGLPAPAECAAHEATALRWRDSNHEHDQHGAAARQPHRLASAGTPLSQIRFFEHDAPAAAVGDPAEQDHFQRLPAHAHPSPDDGSGGVEPEEDCTVWSL